MIFFIVVCRCENVNFVINRLGFNFPVKSYQKNPKIAYTDVLVLSNERNVKDEIRLNFTQYVKLCAVTCQNAVAVKALNVYFLSVRFYHW